MALSSVIDAVKKNDIFISWKKEHPDSYLVHVFVMLDEAGCFQVGFYDKKTKQITSFQYDGEMVTSLPPSPVFQGENKEIKELDIEQVKLSYEEALEKSDSFRKKKHAGETPLKSFLILQHLPIGTVYNITYVTQSFKTLNIKIDAMTGEIKTHSLDKLIDVVK